MLKKIALEYEKFLKFECDFQKNIGRVSLDNLVLISGITCIGKSTFLKNHNFTTLFSYKTGENISLYNRQKFITPEKFYKNFINGEYFDIYSINNKFYAYSLEDYFIVQKEYKKVYVDISIETLYKGLKYDVGKIIIIDYGENRLKKNIEKRIKERSYNNKEIKDMLKIIDKEKKMLEYIKKKYKNIKFIKNYNLKNAKNNTGALETKF